MKNNCGILAYDKLVGSLNGRTNKISLDTLAKIAQDNEFLLYPMFVPTDRLSELKDPFIAHFEHHFDTVSSVDDEALYVMRGTKHGKKFCDEVGKDKLNGGLYVLSPDRIDDLIVKEHEAKVIVGARDKWIPKEIRPIMDIAVPVVAGLTAPFTGGMSLPIAAGYSAARGWGGSDEHGMGRLGDIFGGGMKGLALGSLGAMTGGALGLGYGGTVGGLSSGLSGMGKGAMTGAGNFMKSMPFGQTLFGPAEGVGWSTGAAGAGGALGGGLGTVGSLSDDAMAGGVAGLSLPAQGASTFGNIAKGASNIAGGFGSLSGGGKSGTAATTGISAGDQSSGIMDTIKSLFEKGTLGNQIAGYGAQGLSALIPSADYSGVNQALTQGRQDIMSAAGSGGVGGPAMDEMNRIIGADVGSVYGTDSDEYYNALTRRAGEQYDVRREEVKKRYNASGMLHSSEYQNAMADVDQAEADYMTDMAAKLYEIGRQGDIATKMAAAQLMLGVNAEVMKELAGLTQLSVDQAAAKYGVDAGELSSIRAWLVGMGQSILDGK